MIDRTQFFLTSRFNRCRKFKMKNLKDMMCLLVPYYELSAHRGSPSWSQSQFSYQFLFDTSDWKLQISLNTVLEYCFRDPLVTMETGLKSQAIFEIPQVLMGRSLGSRWNTFASMQKKKIATASWKMLETVYLYIIFSSALLSKLQRFNFVFKRRLDYLPFFAVPCLDKYAQWGRGAGYSTNVYTGRLRPEVQPLSLL